MATDPRRRGSKKGIQRRAHRLSAIRNADRIIVLEKGRVAEQGTHEELMAISGFYARLAQGQGWADNVVFGQRGRTGG